MGDRNRRKKCKGHEKMYVIDGYAHNLEFQWFHVSKFKNYVLNMSNLILLIRPHNSKLKEGLEDLLSVL